MAGQPITRARRQAQGKPVARQKDKDRASWQRPPFEPGNELGLKHGATSAKKVQPLADEYVTRMQAVAPWCAVPAFSATVAAWAWHEAMAELMRQYVDAHGMLDAEGVPVPGLAHLDRVEARASGLRRELGLTPAAWAKLVARLGSADGEAAARGIEALQAIGNELDRKLRALPASSADLGAHSSKEGHVGAKEGQRRADLEAGS